MSLPWSSPQRTAVQKVLDNNPLRSNRCENAAAGVVAIAERAGWQASRVFFKNIEGFCILPVGHHLWPPWFMHVATETLEHDWTP